jgi:opacity protein-like surface antigen
MNLTRRITGSTGAEYSLYDTGDTTFRTLQVFVGLQYPIANWLTASLGYSYNQLDPGTGAANNDILDHGKTSSNSVFVSLSMMFDVWPNVGLARGASGALAGIRPTQSASRSVHPRIP